MEYETSSPTQCCVSCTVFRASVVVGLVTDGVDCDNCVVCEEGMRMILSSLVSLLGRDVVE